MEAAVGPLHAARGMFAKQGVRLPSTKLAESNVTLDLHLEDALLPLTANRKFLICISVAN